MVSYGFDPVSFDKWVKKNFFPDGSPRHQNPSYEGWNKYTCTGCGTEFWLQFKLDEKRAKCNRCHRDEKKSFHH